MLGITPKYDHKGPHGMLGTDDARLSYVKDNIPDHGPGRFLMTVFSIIDIIMNSLKPITLYITTL